MRLRILVAVPVGCVALWLVVRLVAGPLAAWALLLAAVGLAVVVGTVVALVWPLLRKPEPQPSRTERQAAARAALVSAAHRRALPRPVRKEIGR